MHDLLLDTHVFIWLVNGDETLSTRVRRIMNKALAQGTVYLSVLSCWEIAMLLEKKRINLSLPCSQWIDDALRCSGVQLASLTPLICVNSCQLSGKIHGDPIDRMLIATARAMQLCLMTRDQSLLHYGKKYHVDVVAA